MSHYILIHGAWEESRMWDDVSPILRDNGHTVTAIDLPGHGENKQPGVTVTTSDYIQAVVDVVSQLDHQVVLVGHSMNGALISRVAEQIPGKIERLIYVTAFLLKDGGSVLEAMQSDADGEVLPEIVFSEDQAFATLPVPALRRVGFHDIEESRIPGLLPLMAEWQSTEPFMANVVLSKEKFGSVPKTYIRTSIDKMVSPALQDSMIANWEVESIFDLKSGHFPAFSVPEELAGVLLQATSVEELKLVSNV